MDIHTINEPDKPNQHLEYVIDKNFSAASKVKLEAFQAMRLLEGWCSEQKASILIDIILSSKPQTLVEIGVFGGKSLIPMAYALKENGQGTIYGIDPWSNIESIQGMDGANKEWWNSVDHQAILDGLVNRIAQFKLNDYITLIRATSLAAIPINDIDLLHIDGNHSEETSWIDVIKWVPYVKSGGFIIFDDVNWQTTSLAVQWLNENCIKQAEIIGDNIWGIWIKP